MNVVKGLYRKMAYRHTWEYILVINLINVMYVVKGLYRKHGLATWTSLKAGLLRPGAHVE